MKIYTKKGDGGKTDLISKRVSKADIRIDVNGTIDEATAYVAFAQTFIEDKSILEILSGIIKKFHLSSYEIALAKEPQIHLEDVVLLEEIIDKYNDDLEPLSKFIYFDNKKAPSILNIARTVVRRAERLLVLLNDEVPLNEHLLKYFNRLSDLLFILARTLEEKN